MGHCHSCRRGRCNCRHGHLVLKKPDGCARLQAWLVLPAAQDPPPHTGSTPRVRLCAFRELPAPPPKVRKFGLKCGHRELSAGLENRKRLLQTASESQALNCRADTNNVVHTSGSRASVLPACFQHGFALALRGAALEF